MAPACVICDLSEFCASDQTARRFLLVKSLIDVALSSHIHIVECKDSTRSIVEWRISCTYQLAGRDRHCTVSEHRDAVSVEKERPATARSGDVSSTRQHCLVRHWTRRRRICRRPHESCLKKQSACEKERTAMKRTWEKRRRKPIVECKSMRCWRILRAEY